MSVDAGLEATEVRVAVTGAIYSNATETPTLPTSASGALTGTGWVGHGFVSTDGVEEVTNQSREPIRAWQNNAVVRELVTEGDASFNFTLLQTNADNLELFYGDEVDPVTGAVQVRPGVAGKRRAFVIDVIDGTAVIRIRIDDGEAKRNGNQVYRSNSGIYYPVTVTAYANADGVSATKFYSELVTP